MANRADRATPTNLQLIRELNFFTPVLQTMTPHNKQLVSLIHAAVQTRKHRTVVHRGEYGLVATPIYPVYRTSTIEHLLDLLISHDEVIARLATPERWVCNGKYASSGAEAVRLAEKARAARAAARAPVVNGAVKGEGTERGQPVAELPQLQGTIKQVLWATNIRAKHADTNPAAPALKDRTTAAWWIENRGQL